MFCLIFVFHKCVPTTMPSRFTVSFIIARLLACAKILRKFPTTIAGFTLFLGVLYTWFINPAGYNVRCKGDDLEQVSNTYTMVLLVMALASNVQNNIK